MSDPNTTLNPLSAAEFERLMAPFAPHVGERLAVAVSGGADSLALVLALAAWARPRNIQVTALTVDHGLRAGSAAEARQVSVWLSRAEVPHHILTWTGGAAVNTGVQARARAARYALMAEWCRGHAVATLFVAHHQNDQAETFLMRLRRSSTLFGLASMAQVRELHGILLCRPFLDVAKVRLEATLQAVGQAWITDPSNANTAFERVRTRALLNHLEGEGVTAEGLASAARAAGRVAEMIDRAVVAFELTAVTSTANGGFEMDRRAFCALPQVVRERVLVRLLNRVDGRVYAPSPEKVERLARWLADHAASPTQAHTQARTLGGCIVRRTEETLSILPEPPRRLFQQAKKLGLFAFAPLPRLGKSLTSRTGSGAHADARAHTKY